MGTSDAVIAAHTELGRRLTVEGHSTFVATDGPPSSSPPVLLVHGVPVSSLVWRPVMRSLADRGLASVAPDLLGLGLTARPATADYTWSGLGRHLTATVGAVDLQRFHLVVHDLGGPVGFELAHAMPERVASLTVLNTIVDADGFRRPWVMEPFGHRLTGAAWLRATPRPLFRRLLRWIGIADQTAVSDAELDAHHRLLLGDDRGRAFLQVMRGFERTAAKQARYRAVVGSDRYPVQVLWGERDTALPIRTAGLAAARAAGVEPHRLPAKHFLQLDQAPAVADAVSTLAAAGGTATGGRS